MMSRSWSDEFGLRRAISAREPWQAAVVWRGVGRGHPCVTVTSSVRMRRVPDEGRRFRPNKVTPITFSGGPKGSWVASHRREILSQLIGITAISQGRCRPLDCLSNGSSYSHEDGHAPNGFPLQGKNSPPMGKEIACDSLCFQRSN